MTLLQMQMKQGANSSEAGKKVLNLSHHMVTGTSHAPAPHKTSTTKTSAQSAHTSNTMKANHPKFLQYAHSSKQSSTNLSSSQN